MLLLASSPAPPGRIHAFLDGLVKNLVWFLSLPDSVIGASAAATLLFVVLIVQYRRGPKTAFVANIGDFAAVVYVALQFVTLATTESFPNTVHFLVPSVVALCGYLTIRLLPATEAFQLALLRMAVCIGLLLAIADLDSFSKEVLMLDAFPRSGFAPLHANLPLVGGPSLNDSIMLALAILPFALASYVWELGRRCWFACVGLIAAATLVAVISVSFSRGIYVAFLALSVVGFALMWRNRVLSARLVATFFLVACLSGVIATTHFGVTKAVAVVIANKSVSGQRSTTGRFSKWKSSLQTIKEHPIVGIGGYSDGYESLAALKDSPDKPFTVRTYNAALEAFLSSGIIGLLSYAIFLAYPIIQFIRRSWTPMAGIPQTQAFSFLAAGTIALLVRDMTYTSLVLDGRTILVTWTTMALLQNFVAVQRNEIAGANAAID